MGTAGGVKPLGDIALDVAFRCIVLHGPRQLRVASDGRHIAGENVSNVTTARDTYLIIAEAVGWVIGSRMGGIARIAWRPAEGVGAVNL